MLRLEYNIAEKQQEKTEIALRQTYVFLRLTALLKQSGYRELSTALWQALLDIVVLPPPNVTFEDIIPAFEEYWNSELPRLGESMSSGWRAYMSRPKPQLPEPITYQPDAISSRRNIFSQFTRVEEAAEKALHQPGRTLDEAGEDDPFHIILFSDLQPFLSALIFTTEIVRPLIHAFICFSELPPLVCNDKFDYGEWWIDSYLQTQTEDLWDTAKSPYKWTKELPTCWRWSRMTTDLLYSDAFPENISINRDWVQNVLRELTHSQIEWTQLAEYFIAFQKKYFGPS
jgi:hypothetical protein